jgi:hypothetical protein
VSLLNTSPEQYGDIARRMDSGLWYEAAKMEMRGVIQMKVASVVKRPKKTRIIKNRYVFNVKTCGLVGKSTTSSKIFCKKGEESQYSPVVGKMYLSKCNGVNYRTAAGALIHLASHSRPDLGYTNRNA